MNRSSNDPVRWTRRRWVYTTVAVFGLQVGLLFVLELRSTPPARPDQPPAGIYPALDPESDRQLARLPLLQDPTLFVLPAPQSYSGRAWLGFAPPEHRLSDWNEPPRWLDFNAQPLGEPFAGYAKTVTNRPLRIADLPLPALTGADLPVPNQPVGQTPKITVEGHLLSRPLLAPIPLAPWPHTELLTNTVIQLAVDAEGVPMVTTLLAESGLRAADLFALEQAAHARFEPLRPLRPPDDPVLSDLRLTWGKLVFHWQTLLPTATNTVAAPPTLR